MVKRLSTHVPGIFMVHRAKGTVYVVRWRDCKRVRCSKPFPTMKAAQAFQGRNKAAKAEGTYSDPHAGRVLFAQVAKDWLKAKEHGGKVRPQTLYGYRSNLTRHVLPTFGTRRVDSMTRRDVENWLFGFRSVTGKPVMPSTVRHAFFVLQAVLSYAVDHELIRSTPCARIEVSNQPPVGRAKRTGHFLTRGQVDALACAVDLRDDRVLWTYRDSVSASTLATYLPVSASVDGLLVRFAAGVGLRASEIAALRVEHLRLARREVRVEGRIKARWGYDKPKSATSIRAVPILDDDLLDRLTAYLAGHPRRDEPDAPLWPGRTPQGALDWGTPGADRVWNHEAFYRNRYRPAVKSLGLSTEPFLGVNFHDLRHTCGSQWLEDGHNMYAVSRWLGHASIRVTEERYAHVAAEPDYSAAIERTRRARGL